MIAAFLIALAAGSGAPAVGPQDPPIRLFINEDRHFERGDRAKVQVETDDDGYVVVLHADPEGRVRILFPLDPGDDNFLRGGHRYELRGRGDRESFTVDVSSGEGTIYAAVSPDPFKFDEFVQGDHWDYRALNATQLGSDPEPDLTDMVRRMAGGRFDYDLLTYDVSYGTSYNSTAYYAPAAPIYVRPSYYDPFCDLSWDCDPYYFSGRSGLSVNLIFGRPYRYSYYDPFAYDPFYYDPFYYGSYRYRPAYRYPGNYGGYYGGYYGHNSRTYQGPIYSPYQFKAVNRTWSGVGAYGTLSRNGRDVRQATHTVYGQPPAQTPIIGTPSRPDLDGSPKVSPAARARDDAMEMRRQRVEESRSPERARASDDRRNDQPREVKASPSENRGESRDNGRRADPVRETQRDRQAERTRRMESFPEARRVQPDPREVRAGSDPREVRAAPENRSWQAPRRESAPVERPEPRDYQRPERAEPRQYQPREREQPREQPRMSPPPQRAESPRAEPSRGGGGGGGYARPSQANRGRFR